LQFETFQKIAGILCPKHSGCQWSSLRAASASAAASANLHPVRAVQNPGYDQAAVASGKEQANAGVPQQAWGCAPAAQIVMLMKAFIICISGIE